MRLQAGQRLRERAVCRGRHITSASGINQLRKGLQGRTVVNCHNSPIDLNRREDIEFTRQGGIGFRHFRGRRKNDFRLKRSGLKRLGRGRIGAAVVCLLDSEITVVIILDGKGGIRRDRIIGKWRQSGNGSRKTAVGEVIGRDGSHFSIGCCHLKAIFQLILVAVRQIQTGVEGCDCFSNVCRSFVLNQRTDTRRLECLRITGHDLAVFLENGIEIINGVGKEREGVHRKGAVFIPGFGCQHIIVVPVLQHHIGGIDESDHDIIRNRAGGVLTFQQGVLTGDLRGRKGDDPGLQAGQIHTGRK